ncbi:lysozyme family protein, partial [Streptomyces capparidis]
GRATAQTARAAVLAAAVAAGALALRPDGGDGGRADGPAATSSRAPSAPPSPAASSPAAPAPGEIPAGADVPAALREPITRAAHRCTEEEVTPVLIAAMLKAESGFDADAARPEADEYGIAMWTPAVFNAWAVDGDQDGDKDYMSPPDAIATMGGYVCWLGQRFKQEGMDRAQLPALVAAGYRTSDRAVIEAGGVPERTRPHVDEVLGHLAEYSA